jgi:hypothetical protein
MINKRLETPRKTMTSSDLRTSWKISRYTSHHPQQYHKSAALSPAVSSIITKTMQTPVTTKQPCVRIKETACEYNAPELENSRQWKSSSLVTK